MADTYQNTFILDLSPRVQVKIYLVVAPTADEVTFSEEVVAHVLVRLSESIGISDETPAHAGLRDMVLIYDGVNVYSPIGQKTIHITDPRYFKRKNA